MIKLGSMRKGNNLIELYKVNNKYEVVHFFLLNDIPKQKQRIVTTNIDKAFETYRLLMDKSYGDTETEEEVL